MNKKNLILLIIILGLSVYLINLDSKSENINSLVESANNIRLNGKIISDDNKKFFIENFNVLRDLGNTDDLKKYGLTKPVMNIEIINGEKAENIYVGNLNPKNSGRYILYKKNVYILDINIIKKITGGEDDKS